MNFDDTGPGITIETGVGFIALAIDISWMWSALGAQYDRFTKCNQKEHDEALQCDRFTKM